MTKLIQLTLSKIKYGGDSIGDDIRIEVDCLNHSVEVNKKVKNGSEVALAIPVGDFVTDQSSFSLPLSIKVIERDLIFSDFGSIEATFNVDTHVSAPQNFTAIVEVREKRNYETKKKATFTLSFEARVTDAMMYVSFEMSTGGWTRVLSEPSKKEIALPAYLKVRLEREEKSRQYFTILEGVRRGEKASVTLDQKGVSFLQAGNPYTSPVHFTYSLSTRILKLKTRKYQTLDYKDDEQPWEKRLYMVAIPDSPHEGGETYLGRAALARVWFKTSHPDGRRYVHPGKYTAGCITLTEIERWDELCKILLKARKGDGYHIGTVEVTE